MLTEREIYALWVEYRGDSYRLVQLFTDRKAADRKAEELNCVQQRVSTGAHYWITSEQLLEGESSYGD